MIKKKKDMLNEMEINRLKWFGHVHKV